MRTSLNRAQAGVGHIGIVIALIVLFVAGSAGYYVWQNNKDKSSDNSTAVVNKELDAECRKYYDDKDFCKFASSWSYGGEQKMTMTTPEDESVSVYETDGSGNTRVVMSEGGEEAYAAITLGNNTYIKNPASGQWTKYTAEENDTDTQLNTEELEQEFDFDSEIAKDTTKIEKLDKEACGGLNCFKYKMTDSSLPGEETTIWFDDKDYKLRKMTNVNSEGTMTIEFEYSVETITEPSPVVDAPDFSDVENMSAEQIQQMMEQFGQ